MRRYALVITLGTLALAFSVRPALHADSALYKVDDLGTTPDGLVPYVTGINGSGQVSGYVVTANGTARGVRYTDGTGWSYLTGLTTADNIAYAINDSGDLAGYRQTSTGPRAFRYVDGTGVEDITPLAQSSFSIGMSINANGDVAGYDMSTAGAYRGWRASPGLPAVQLPTLGGSAFTLTCGINNAGQIAGMSMTAQGSFHAYRINADNTTVDAGSFDGPTGMSSACAIDQDGRIGGFAQGNGLYHAFRFLSALQNVEGSLPVNFESNIESISGGNAAGWYFVADWSTRAFLYTDAAGAVDLNTQIAPDSGWLLLDVKGINAKGQMAGDGQLNGNPRAFRLSLAAVPDTTPPVISNVTVTPSSIWPPNRTNVPVTVGVTATDDSGVTPTCSLTGISGPGTSGVDYSVTGTLSGSVNAYAGRTYVFTVTCTDRANNSSSASANVVVPPDVTAPSISSVTAAPSTIWPPKGQIVGVTVSVAATDDSTVAPACSLASISGPGTAGVDYVVTGAFTGNVKAVGGRTYTFTASCSDYSGNASAATVNVVVPPDTTPPTITSLSITPSVIWPPDGRMIPVAVSVTATDDVDDAPVCSVTSVAAPGMAADDAVVTGQFTASVKGIKSVDGSARVYSVLVTCSDFSGNKSRGTVTVTVPHDASQSTSAIKPLR